MAEIPPRVILSLAVPFYNEGSGVDVFFEKAMPVLRGLGVSYEIVCVNDGSRDDTLARLRRFAETNPEVTVVDLTRNFGKEAALTAALAHCRGEAVVPIDSDLQDPPDVIDLLLKTWRSGFDVVLAKRAVREGESTTKRATARLFYKVYNRLSQYPIEVNVGDFRLMSRRVVEAVLALPEKTRFNKGLFSWVGYPTAVIEYHRAPRATGTTKWNYWRLWNFALDGLFAFSTVPLRVWTYLGVLVALCSFGYAGFLIARTLIFGVVVPGYASLMVVILLAAGVQLIGLGILGEYLARIYQEVKRRPLYLVRDVISSRPPS